MSLEKVYYNITDEKDKSFRVATSINKDSHVNIKQYNAKKIKGIMTGPILSVTIAENNADLTGLVLSPTTRHVTVNKNKSIPMLNDELEEAYFYQINGENLNFEQLFKHVVLMKLIIEQSMPLSTYNFSGMKGLKVLSLANNSITTISTLSLPYGLEYLNLDSNQITSLDNIYFVDSLQWISINNNRIVSINNSTVFSAQLTHLELQKNNIVKITNCLNSPNLMSINLCGNKLSDLNFLKNNDALQGIVWLDVSENKLGWLTQLPDSIKTIIATGNPIRYLSQLRLPKQLMYLSLTYDTTDRDYIEESVESHMFDEILYITSS